MSGVKRERVDQETTKQAGVFLFSGKEMTSSQFLDTRTRVSSDKMMRLLLYYDLMGEVLASSNAVKIGDSMKRLLISQESNRGPNGRGEAVQVLQQNFPRRVEIEKGWDSESVPRPS